MVEPAKLQRWYREVLSDIDAWDQLVHCDRYLLYPSNLTTHVAIDEVAMKNSEFVTLLTSRNTKGHKGKLISLVHGVRSADIVSVINRIPLSLRNKVKEATADMSQSMLTALEMCFPKARIVVDHFHVIQLVCDALQHFRIKLRWDAIELENELIEQAKKQNKKYQPYEYPNGETLKQLLARGRYLLYKASNQWSRSQKIRAQILFSIYPDLQKAYYYVLEFRRIYQNKKNKTDARKAFNRWMDKAHQNLPEEFNSAARSLRHHMEYILNFFKERSTNASAESFNAAIKHFRALQKGVKDQKMFLYRMEKLYASK